MLFYSNGSPAWQSQKYKIRVFCKDNLRKVFQDHVSSRYGLSDNLKATLSPWELRYSNNYSFFDKLPLYVTFSPQFAPFPIIL